MFDTTRTHAFQKNIFYQNVDFSRLYSGRITDKHIFRIYLFVIFQIDIIIFHDFSFRWHASCFCNGICGSVSWI